MCTNGRIGKQRIQLPFKFLNSNALLMKKILEILLEFVKSCELVISTDQLEDSNYRLISTLVNRKRIGN